MKGELKRESLEAGKIFQELFRNGGNHAIEEERMESACFVAIFMEKV